MNNGLTSKERLLKTINLEEPDHVPLHITFNGDWVKDVWKNAIEAQKENLRLGLDPYFCIYSPEQIHPDVKVKVEIKNLSSKEYPLLVKTYDTPKGRLRQVVVKTSDWPHGDDVPIFDDFSIPASRSRERLIKSYDDLKKLRYILCEPSSDQISHFHQEAKKMRDYCDKKGILLEGVGGYGGDAAIWLCGVERVVTAAYREPNFLRELLSIINEWDLIRVKETLQVGVDMIERRGWYENGDFWSPKMYNKYLRPLIQEEIEVVHKAKVKFHYILVTGIAHLLPILSELDIDLFDGLDPIANPVDLKIIRKAFVNTCIRGGVSEAVTLTQGTPEEIRKAVKRVIEILAPGGGFILGTIYSIFTKETWEKKFPVLMDTWKKFRKYPIRRSR